MNTQTAARPRRSAETRMAARTASTAANIKRAARWELLQSHGFEETHRDPFAEIYSLIHLPDYFWDQLAPLIESGAIKPEPWSSDTTAGATTP